MQKPLWYISRGHKSWFNWRLWWYESGLWVQMSKEREKYSWGKAEGASIPHYLYAAVPGITSYTYTPELTSGKLLSLSLRSLIKLMKKNFFNVFNIWTHDDNITNESSFLFRCAVIFKSQKSRCMNTYKSRYQKHIFKHNLIASKIKRNLRSWKLKHTHSHISLFIQRSS